MKKILPVLLLAIGLVIGYKYWTSPNGISDQLQPPVDTTQDLKTYANKAWGFSFSYPLDWVLEEVTSQTDADFLSLILKFEDATQDKIQVYSTEQYPMYSIQVMARKNTKGLSAKEEYVSQFINPPEVAIKEISYGGLPGVEYPEPTAPASGSSTAVLLASDTNLYSFIYSAMATTATHTRHLDVFTNVLESVKFE